MIKTMIQLDGQLIDAEVFKEIIGRSNSLQFIDTIVNDYNEATGRNAQVVLYNTKKKKVLFS